MSKKSRSKRQKIEVGYDFDDLFDDDFEYDDSPGDAYGANWDFDEEIEEKYSARRKIERRRDMKKLYSELNDWEEFGMTAD